MRKYIYNRKKAIWMFVYKKFTGVSFPYNWNDCSLFKCENNFE